MIIATHYTSPPDICYTGNREKKNPTIWKQQQKWRRDYHHFVARSPPTLPSPRFLYVREVHWLYESRIKGAIECVLSFPTYYLHSRTVTLFQIHSFLPSPFLKFFGIALTLYTPSTSRGDALPSYRVSVFLGVFGCCLQQERTQSPKCARPSCWLLP